MAKIAPTHQENRTYLVSQAEELGISNIDDLSNEMLTRAMQIIANNDGVMPNQD